MQNVTATPEKKIKQEVKGGLEEYFRTPGQSPRSGRTLAEHPSDAPDSRKYLQVEVQGKLAEDAKPGSDDEDVGTGWAWAG